MLLLQEQEQFVKDLNDIEDKLFILTTKYEDSQEIGKSWHIIYKLLKKEKQRMNKMRENTQS